MTLKKAIEDIVLEKYPNYKTKISVVNNTVRLKLVFKTEDYANNFVKVLSKALRQRLDSKFMIFYEYLEGDIPVQNRVIFPKGKAAPPIIEPEDDFRDSNNRRIKII